MKLQEWPDGEAEHTNNDEGGDNNPKYSGDTFGDNHIQSIASVIKFLNRKTLTVVLIAALIWLGNVAYHVYNQRATVQFQVDDLESKLSRVQRDNQFLASSSAYFKSDEYLEKQARLELNYKLSDEQVAFIYPDKAEKVASASASADPVTWSSWLNWFTNIFKK